VGHRFQVYLPWEYFIPGSIIHSGRVDDSVTVGCTVTAVLVFLSYAIVLNTVVPISLYVRYRLLQLNYNNYYYYYYCY